MGYYGYGYYLDPTYVLVLIGALLCLFAQAKISITYSRYAKYRSRSGLTGAQAAQRILEMSGIYDVRIERVGGKLTDHYDPSAKVLRLSESTYDSPSVAAIGVAAHECGHAVQHQKDYGPLKLRSALVPAANLGSQAGIPLIILGAILGMNQVLIQIGIWVFALAVLFPIVTLPVEFDASRRALAMLDGYGLMEKDETDWCRKVLRAAAFTYVAAAATSILQLLRLVVLFGGGKRRD